MNFCLAAPTRALSESNMKIFADYTDILYGQPSDVVLYNTIKSDRLFSIEETHIMITVPIYSKLSSFTLRKPFLSLLGSNNLDASV